MTIDRCTCYHRTFKEIKEVAERTGAASIDELQDHIIFGENCQLCHPYVRRMLRTGETVFHEPIRKEDEPPPVG